MHKRTVSFGDARGVALVMVMLVYTNGSQKMNLTELDDPVTSATNRSQFSLIQ